jgi:gamma-glutamylcyclotransferase (GGCT)/AIG2-like uncharacterized protein YtfP
LTSHLFVYGTLRRLYGHERHALLERNATFAGEGTVQGQLFNLGNYPGLVLSQDPLDRVLGEVYHIDPFHFAETMRELDDYEGLALANPEYRREIVCVRMADRSAIEAWAYILNRDPRVYARIVSGDYLRFN